MGEAGKGRGRGGEISVSVWLDVYCVIQLRGYGIGISSIGYLTHTGMDGGCGCTRIRGCERERLSTAWWRDYGKGPARAVREEAVTVLLLFARVQRGRAGCVEAEGGGSFLSLFGEILTTSSVWGRVYSRVG